MAKTIPDHSPLLAPDLVCHGCGEFIKPEIVQNRNGVVEFLRYTHKNPKVGCSYQVETNAMIVGEMKPLREDGTPVKL